MPRNKFLHQVSWWSRHPIEFLWRIAGGVYRKFHPMEPWISRGAIRFLDAHLKSSMQGIEWGSGRSTVWLAPRLGKLTSVEHNRDWHSFVSKQLQECGIGNVDHRFVALEHAESEPTYPLYTPMPKYVAVADEFADNSVDFVLIDGHYRQACVPAAMKKLRPGGFLTIDNSNWMPQSEWGVPESWRLLHRSMGFESETSIWQKP